MSKIELKDVSLRFRVRKNGRIPFKDFLIKHFFRKATNPWMEVDALRHLNLTLSDGDRLGIVGHNGAGKTTLLKVLAGIYPSTAGELNINGRISSLINMNVGVEADASGWENIEYRLYLQGATPAVVREKRQAIADFSELGEFIHMPVRYYSFGMMLRLCFSIATTIEPEILLLDEILSAGDAAFQEKAEERINELMANARILVFASHDLEALAKICNKAIWMDHGTIKLKGTPDEVIQAYIDHVHATPAKAA